MSGSPLYQEIPRGILRSFFEPPPEPEPPVLSEVLWTPARGGAAQVLGLWIGLCGHCGCDGLSVDERAALREVEDER